MSSPSSSACGIDADGLRRLDNKETATWPLEGKVMDGADAAARDWGLAARDPRVRSILTEPDAYFSAARRRAWPQARADVELELHHRRRARRDGHRGLRRFQAFRRRQAADPGHDHRFW